MLSYQERSLLLQMSSLDKRISDLENDLLTEKTALTNFRQQFEEFMKTMDDELNTMKLDAAREESPMFTSNLIRIEEFMNTKELNAARKESLTIAFNLVRMFRFYFLPTDLKWNNLRKQCAKLILPAELALNMTMSYF